MTTTTYDNGDLVRLAAVFTDPDTGVALDPTSVFFQVRTPAGVITSYTYGVDVGLVKDSTGHYHLGVDANADGAWMYRVHSTGTGQAAAEAVFLVESSFV